MREYFIAGNWKMNKIPGEVADYVADLLPLLSTVRHRLLIAPSFVALPAAASALAGSPIMLGAQNMAAAESGAYTGEISPDMLMDIGVKYVILGHSERRALFGETDELINTKVRLALSKGLKVILCVGETLEEREAGLLEKVITRNVADGLRNIGESDISALTIAYEPVWAIGTGKTATPQDADEVHALIRRILTEIYSRNIAGNMIIQYGGSVKPANVRELMSMENIDGALVGGASLNIDDFAAIANFDK